MNDFKKIVLFFAFVLMIISVDGQTVAQNHLTQKEIRKGWILLFDGKTTNGWIKSNGQPFPENGWDISDGELSIKEQQKGGDIVTVDEYSEFDFSIEFKLSLTCNSGVKYFYTEYTTGGRLGMEYQLLDDINASDNSKENHLCGSLYDIFPPKTSKKKMKPVGQWNTARIVCKGKNVEHWLNGVKVLSFKRGSEEYLNGVGQSKYKTDPVFGMVEKGRILLQDHGHAISFRNIKLRRL
jgi:hypothetical protein